MIIIPREGVIRMIMLPETKLEDDFIHQKHDALVLALRKLTLGAKTETIMQPAYDYVSKQFQLFKASATPEQLARHTIKVTTAECLKLKK